MNEMHLVLRVSDGLRRAGILNQRNPFVLSIHFDSCNLRRSLALKSHVRSNIVVKYLITSQNWRVRFLE